MNVKFKVALLAILEYMQVAKAVIEAINRKAII